MFADFEMQAHNAVQSGQPLIPEKLNQLHKELNRHYYGGNFVVDEELGSEWSRIPHFYTAFYVYQYATGISAATALAKRVLTEEKSLILFVFCRKGGHKKSKNKCQ